MNCPVCNKELEFDLTDLEDFYYDCSVCKSSLSFQKGKCEVISRGQAPQSETNSSATQIYDNQEESISRQSIKQASLPDSPLESSLESSSFLQNQEIPFQQENTLKESSQDPAIETNPSQTHTNEAFSEDPVFSTDEITEVPEIEEDEASFIFKEEEELEPAKEDFSEVVEFSKNKKQQEKGLYLYKLFLSEINSQVLKERVISVLEEEYLEIDLQECPSYKESIKHKGKIDLPNISPIQVYVILHHLMGLPLKIYWEQSHIADS